MTMRHKPISSRLPKFLHGGDYNPDQWPESVWDDDMRLMKLANCNAMSVGIFAWARLEPEEGKFDLGWLDRIMDKLTKHGAVAVLATPSGARPAWMSHKYPEVLRVTSERVRILHGGRHNHCMTSPVYREKCRTINRTLAERYRQHPALAVWHISNEYGGDCHCELCQQAFREWLKGRYDGSLDRLNQAWWTAFWSHTYTDWSQIESPTRLGEISLHGLNLDWKRFVTYQTTEFMKAEIEPLKQMTPDIPVTTNFMGTYEGLNYWKMAPELDVVSWDSYPAWKGTEEDVALGADIAFIHDLNRSLKGGRPFMLMESTPSMTNWMSVCKPKRPRVHRLASLQAVAHGADTVQYFQWRKSRGGPEKLHGAVVDHVGHENTRVFRDVADLGATLAKLDAVIGTTVLPEVAIVYDWENNWAMADAQGPRREKKDYLATCMDHYREFWKRGIPVDVIDEECDLSRYRLVVAPMLYLLRGGMGTRIPEFVRAGGTFVTTYWSGIVDEHDLCHLGGFPGPLRECLGIWSEEIDALYEGEVNRVVPVAFNALGLAQAYQARELCDLIHAETAEVLAHYGADFYSGRPALTVNHFGKGHAYYVASRNDKRFLRDFTTALVDQLALRRTVGADLPEGVTAQLRTDGLRRFVFLLNFAATPRTVALGTQEFVDVETGVCVRGSLSLDGFESRVLEEQAG